MPVIRNIQGHVGTMGQHIQAPKQEDPMLVTANMFAGFIQQRVRDVPTRVELMDKLQKLLNEIRTAEGGILH